MPRFGLPHHHFRVTDSTNERARELAAAGAPSGTVVTAEAQTAGRGRRGRSWVASPGTALLHSSILRPPDQAHSLLPLAVPVAVCEAIESLAPVRCAIKWPNDIWIDARKVAGVLIEARIPDWVVIGVGVNVTDGPSEPGGELRWPAASVGHGVDVERLRVAVDRALDRWVEAGSEEVLAGFRERDALRGRTVSWEDQGEGRSGVVDGVDENGNLLVALGGVERVVLAAGEVSLAIH